MSIKGQTQLASHHSQRFQHSSRFEVVVTFRFVYYKISPDG
jgi:hypothetical protein